MTGFNGLSMRRRLDINDEQVMLLLWREGNSTMDIAQIMCIPEATIANRLPHVLARARKAAGGPGWPA